MTVRIKALLWATIIIEAALIAVALNLNAGASFGIISGLSGAALGTLSNDAPCGWRHLQ